jgi:hypothetical protein
VGDSLAEHVHGLVGRALRPAAIAFGSEVQG